jgi:hypothetical protein
MLFSTIITIMSVCIILLYIIIQLFDFYGVGTDVYAIYIYFCLLILFCCIVLPHRKEL